MFSSTANRSDWSLHLDPLDRAVVSYLSLPLVIFLVSWLRIWAALPLIACVCFALRPLLDGQSNLGSRLRLSRTQIMVAIIVGAVWTVLGGTGHLVFANPDWYVRDAVLHDLVESPWPVGYGLLDGQETMLRAPVAYYLPAAIVGKLAGLASAHAAMAVWTAMGSVLFLLQVLSLTPPRLGIAISVAAAIVFFSGFDVIGCLISNGPRFIANWHIAGHIEWWAGTYQYSSMTTQLFWVPNHALGAWLVIGLLYRDGIATPLDRMLPILLVSSALWSPLSAIGVLPFVLLKVFGSLRRETSLRLLHPRVWVPALAVGVVVAAYLTLDPSRIAKGFAVGKGGFADTAFELLRQFQFFLLEAGLLGLAIIAIRWSSELILALIILALLPLVYLGPGNDLVMRASIPSLTVLAIAAAGALVQAAERPMIGRRKFVLGCCLAIGAVTPVQEIARAFVLRPWPINMKATLIGTNCGAYPAHYIARVGDQLVTHLLRQPHRISIGPQNQQTCENPGVTSMWKRGLL